MIEWIIAAGSLGIKMFMCFKAMMKHIMMMHVLFLFVFKFHKFDFESESKIAVVSFSIWFCFGILLWILRMLTRYMFNLGVILSLLYVKIIAYCCDRALQYNINNNSKITV